MTETEHELDFGLSKDITYLMGELWSVYCDDFEENLLHLKWHQTVYWYFQ